MYTFKLLRLKKLSSPQSPFRMSEASTVFPMLRHRYSRTAFSLAASLIDIVWEAALERESLNCNVPVDGE